VSREGWTITPLRPPALPDPPGGGVSRGVDAPGLLTGTGTVALWSPREGLQKVLNVDGRWTAAVRLRVDGRALPAARSGEWGPGTAVRRIPLAGGGELVERVILPDTAPGVMLVWSLEGCGPGELSLEVEDGSGERLSLPVTSHAPAAGWLALAGGRRPVPPDPAAQALRRASRGVHLDGPTLDVQVQGDPGAEVGGRLEAALRALDDAPMDEGPDGEPAPPFLLGVEADPGAPGDAGLRWAEGGVLVEVALGALAGGRWSLARAILESLVSTRSAPALPLLTLAAEWGLATGDARLLRALRPSLDGALEAALDDGGHPLPPPGAAFPTLPRVLERLADAVEPSGDRAWTAELRALARRRVAPTSMVLPVLGAPLPVPSGEGARDAVLPPAEGFAHPDAPGLLGRRTLHAARLVRALVRGTLGIVPDAAYGRLRVGPALPVSWQAVEVRGIRAADARVDLGYRREGDRHTFVLRPVAGRVPLTLILEPSLPLEEVRSVELEGERVTVDSFRNEGRVGVRFQFPLDGERTVVIDGPTLPVEGKGA
jgi:hypothetical protein